MLDYSVSARYNPMEKNEPAHYYAFSQSKKVMGLEEFAKHIATHGCVYKRADIAAVLTMAVDCLREMLLNGYKVELGDLGSFYVTFSSEGTMSPNEFNPVIHVKSVNVNWERGLEFLNLKEDAEFNLVAIRAVQKKVLKAVKNGETVVNLVDEESTETTETTI
ncbi:MAG: DNA-binding protein [Bacteroides sp.]|nr:DNA-binding protein [Bacteroides sp.]